MTVIDAVRRRFAGLAVRPAELAQITLLSGSLRELGWYPRRRAGAFDGDGGHVPWLTYAATEWLGRALRAHHRVFEFGSGSSTIWLAERTRSVIAVEEDERWERIVRDHLPANATVRFVRTPGPEIDEAPISDPYPQVLNEYSDPFDVIIVDGRGRNACVSVAVDHLAEGGLIVLDDADRGEYRPSFELLAQRGFGRIDFFGPKPLVGHLSTTCVFSTSFDTWTRDLELPRESGY